MSLDNKNSQKFEKWWLGIRSKGRSRYIWVRGVLGWGLTTGILVAVVNNWDSPSSKLLKSILINMVIFPIGGYFWGVWTWSILERKFLKSQSSDDKMRTG